jgi:hypothetical protein
MAAFGGVPAASVVEQAAAVEKEKEPPRHKDWWQKFDFSELRSFEVCAEGDWWQVNSRRWQGDEVLVRYVGGDPADDFWVRIDDDKVRPSLDPAGTQHGQVGNQVKVMFLEDNMPSWYTGEIIQYCLGYRESDGSYKAVKTDEQVDILKIQLSPQTAMTNDSQTDF